MKLLFIASQFPCYDETFVLREMLAVKDAGIDIEIATIKICRDEIIHDEAKQLESVTVYTPFISIGVLWANLLTLLQQPLVYVGLLCFIFRHCLCNPMLLLKSLALFPKAVAFSRQVKQREIAFVHALWATHATLFAIIIKRLTGIPFSFTGHAHDIYVDTTMLAAKMEAAEFLLTCTADNKRYLGQFGDADKVRVSYHGLDIEKYKPVERVASDCVQLLSVGSLFECKGYEYLIDAIALLKQRGKSVQCTIAGGGPLEQALIKRATDMAVLDQIDFKGYVKQKDMPALYQAADILILPAVLEIHWGIPNVLIEALACAVPVMVTRLPAVGEILQNDDVGTFLAEKSPESIADTVEQWYDKPELRQQMGQAGRQKILASFDVGKNGLVIADYFRQYL